MLALTRETNEVVLIGEIRVMIIRVECGRVRLGIDAPRDVKILREELKDKPRAEAYVSRRGNISPHLAAEV